MVSRVCETKSNGLCRLWLIWLSLSYLSQLLQQLLLTIDRPTHCIDHDPTSSTTDFVVGAFIAKQSIAHHRRARRYSWTLLLGRRWREWEDKSGQWSNMRDSSKVDITEHWETKAIIMSHSWAHQTILNEYQNHCEGDEMTYGMSAACQTICYSWYGTKLDCCWLCS